MKLNTFNIKLTKPKKKLGRGIGSGKGKTSGRGHKGQKSRSGVAIKSFEGGQMPLYRRLPKRGFKSFGNKEKKLYAIVNLSKLEENLKNNRISSKGKLDLSVLQKSDLVNKKYKKLKILGSGDINTKFDIEVNAISESAKKKIEKIGGKVTMLK
tara:strand:- start:4536 stop:4997 length:462 start_codon:yes stop_codon:yes gene_type:complete